MAELYPMRSDMAHVLTVRSAAGLLFNRWHQRHAELRGQFERPAPY
ncbi:hypothetical protein C7S13_6075 [Burkholderia cepacia]|nr:hypothetical protein [Burkholderia cepacia]